ncbi:MAG TPA: ROK family protein [Vicinamibacterales bacterium]|nr:ROK family protein [Vicinamibacterales bacterium]
MPRAVLVGADGHVAGRGEGADVAGAARAAAGDLHVDVAGLALFHGESGDAAIAALRGRARRIDPVEAGGAAVVAETWCGAAKGCRHAVCLLIGDRVAAGLLLDGRVWSGARGRAGAAAWLALNPVERQDYRRFGSLAAEVSGKGIARRLSWRIQAGDRSAVLDRAGDLDAITAAHVFEGARSGDGVSISVVRDTAKYIGMAIANLAATVDPEMVVVGGPVAAAGDLLLDAVRQEAGRWLAPDMMDALRIEFSPLGGDAVAIGAARLAMTAA